MVREKRERGPFTFCGGRPPPYGTYTHTYTYVCACVKPENMSTPYKTLTCYTCIEAAGGTRRRRRETPSFTREGHNERLRKSLSVGCVRDLEKKRLTDWLVCVHILLGSSDTLDKYTDQMTSSAGSKLLGSLFFSLSRGRFSSDMWCVSDVFCFPKEIHPVYGARLSLGSEESVVSYKEEAPSSRKNNID